MRCLTLAGALRERGAGVRFASRELAGNLCDLIQSRGFQVHRLPAPGARSLPADVAAHAAWLGVTWQEDADQTHAALRGERAAFDWLIVDHYALDEHWERRLRERARRIMVIDDLADRRHDCDLLLDQNLVAGMRERYGDKVPVGCPQLLGPQYALLQPEYLDARKAVAPRSGPVKRILVFFGGADRYGLTGLTLEAFLALGRADIDLDVVLSPNMPGAQVLHDRAREHPNVHLHEGLPTLAPLVAAASLAVGAGGASSWERLCLGLPSVVVTLAENQRPIAAELQRRALVRWIGHVDAVDLAALTLTLREIIGRDLDPQWSLACLTAVDGGGLQRVTAALTVDARTPLRVRRAAASDELLSLDWANDPLTRKNALAPEPISSATHHAWFQSKLQDADGSQMYIVETPAQVPIGQVRFDRGGQGWRISYSLAPEFRGRGCGSGLLQAALQKLGESHAGALVRAEVKEGNLPSCKVFESLGFEQLPAIPGMREYARRI